jgi:hypothetical protein
MLFPGGIQTRVFCPSGKYDIYCATPPRRSKFEVCNMRLMFLVAIFGDVHLFSAKLAFYVMMIFAQYFLQFLAKYFEYQNIFITFCRQFYAWHTRQKNPNVDLRVTKCFV